MLAEVKLRHNEDHVHYWTIEIPDDMKQLVKKHKQLDAQPNEVSTLILFYML